jgi:hypothetical protein
MSNIIGEVEYLVKLNTKDLKGGVSDAKATISSIGDSATDSEGKLSKLASFGKAGLGLLTGAATGAATAIVGIGKAALDSYADFEQFSGGAELIFGEEVGKNLEEQSMQFSNIGLSANDYLSTMNKLGPAMINATGDQAKAVEIINQSLTDQRDIVTATGADADMVSRAFEGLARNNFTMLDNLQLGIAPTQEGMVDLINKTGVAGKEIKNLDEVSLDQMYEAIHKVVEENHLAGNAARESSETISGSVDAVKASWENVLTVLASGDNEAISGAISTLVENIGNAFRNITAILPPIIEGIVQLIQELVPIILEQLPILLQQLLPGILQATISLVQSIVQALPQILSSLVAIVIELVKILTAPENLQAILQAALTLLLGIVQAIPQIIIALVEALPDIIDNLITFLTDPKTIEMLIKASVQLFLALVQAVPQILGALFSAFGQLFSNLWNRLKSTFQSCAGNFGQALGQMFKNAINGVLGFIENFLNGPINAINSLIGVINNVPGINLSYLNRISLGRMATGGIVPSTAGGRLILAGEGGEDEWVVPESKMASMLQQLGGARGNITINVEGIYATSESQKREVALDIWNKIQEVDRSRMGAMAL